MNLTDAQIRGFKPSVKRLRKSDGGGLFIDVMPTGKKIFRLAYRFGGKQRTLVVGEYPTVKLADARLKAAQHKLSLRNGIDPQTTLKPKVPEVAPEPVKGPLWRDVAKDYLVLRDRSGGALATLRKLTRQVEVTIEALGDREISTLTAMDVLSVVNPIAERGKVETAHEIRARFSQIFRFAAARGLVAYDPASVTIDAMIPRGRGEFAGLTDPKAVGQLMLDIRQYTEKHIWVGSALLISAYLFPRNTELRGMHWDEINWKEQVWDVPGERMKMKRDHVIPLPRQAIEVLKQVQQYDVGSAYVFPAPRNPVRMLSDNTFNKALRSMGYDNSQHVHHGFRTTASTLLNELGWNSDWIERQLAHVQRNKVRAAYNKAQYLEGRREMMQAYADHLDKLANDAASS